MSAVALGFLSTLATSGAMTAANPILNSANQDANKIIPITKPDPNTLFRLKRKKIIDDKTYFEFMRTWGYNETIAAEMYVGDTQLLGVQENIILYRKEKLKDALGSNKENYIRNLGFMGIGVRVAEQLLDATEVIANEQQLITFMVREVFNDTIRTKFGQDLEFPDDIAENKTKILPEFAKIGISETLARRLWAAHWELPEFQRAALAFYRYAPEDKAFWKDEITDMKLDPELVATEFDTLDTLLKTQDVMPFWRQKILATAFQDLGQLQIRWAIRFRFVKYEEAVYLHKRQGLPPKWAELVTKIVFVVQSITDWKDGMKQGSMSFKDVETELNEWHITEPSIIKIVKQKLSGDELESVTKYREISLAKVVKAFKQKQIEREKAVELIQKLKYEEATAKFILEVETFDDTVAKPQKEKDLTKSDIIAAFKVDRLTKAESKTKLLELLYSEDEAAMLLDIAERVKLGKSDKEKIKERDLTKTDILRSLKLGLRTAQDAFDGLVLLKYSQDEAIELVEQTLQQTAISEAKK